MEKFSAEEYSELSEIIVQLTKHLPYPIAEWGGVTFLWNDKITLDSGKMGKFRYYQPHRIVIAGHMRPAGVRHVISIVVHELTHMYQFQHNPVRYALCAVPLIRKYTLEPMAYDNEEAAYETMQREF